MLRHPAMPSQISLSIILIILTSVLTVSAEPITIDTCYPALQSAATTYLLSRDVLSQGCTPYKDSITLDCQGHSISFSQPVYVPNLEGIATFTLKNCVLKAFTTALFVGKEGTVVNIIDSTFDDTDGGTSMGVLCMGAGSQIFIKNLQLKNVAYPFNNCNLNYFCEEYETLFSSLPPLSAKVGEPWHLLNKNSAQPAAAPNNLPFQLKIFHEFAPWWWRNTNLKSYKEDDLMYYLRNMNPGYAALVAKGQAPHQLGSRQKFDQLKAAGTLDTNSYSAFGNTGYYWELLRRGKMPDAEQCGSYASCGADSCPTLTQERCFGIQQVQECMEVGGCKRWVITQTCPVSQSCSAGSCITPCAPSCAGRQCGDDGCGGSCGSCPGDLPCSYGSCQADPCTSCPAGKYCEADRCSSDECGVNGCHYVISLADAASSIPIKNAGFSFLQGTMLSPPFLVDNAYFLHLAKNTPYTISISAPGHAALSISPKINKNTYQMIRLP